MPDTIAQSALRHLAAGRPEQAAAVLARALARAPADPELNSLMCRALASQGKLRQAEFYIARAAAQRPADADILNDLGNCLALLGRSEQAVAVLRRAVAADPGHLGAAVSLAAVLNTLHRPISAARHCQSVAPRFPGSPHLAVAHATALLQAAHARRAAEVLREALRTNPGDPELLRRLAFTLNYVDTATPDEVASAHRAAGSALAASLPTPPAPAFTAPAAANHPTPNGRPLRIGILSPDLRTHSVASFVQPVLEHLDRGEFEITCYSDTRAEDATTDRLRPLAARWRNVDSLRDDQLAAQVRADRIDILLELAGYTSKTRLPALLLRPAPVIATYIGYPNSTGLRTVDDRIVDSITDPPGAEAHSTERLRRLDPCFLCYAPPADAPPVAPPPSASSRVVTFGCFNAVQKLGESLLLLWSEVLDNVPGSRLTLKSAGLDEPELADDLRLRCAAAGIAAERIDLLPYAATRAAHLAAYSRVDVALDTFPYGGTTTTCEALWMGVPVVSLAGQCHASRVGLSLLSAVGLADLATTDTRDYVRLAASLAADGQRRADLRRSLRDRLALSPLGDGPGFGRRLGGALRAMATPMLVAGLVVRPVHSPSPSRG